MPNVDQLMRTSRTPEDVGDVLTIQVTRYDNGLWKVNGQPVYDYEDGKMGGHGYNGAKYVANALIDLFASQIKEN